MKEKELKRLSRADLLEMLIDQSKELQEVREKLQQAEEELKKREIVIGNTGSIANASLMLNSVFEAAQAACREYVENAHTFGERPETAGEPFYQQSPYARPVPAPVAEEPRGIPYDQYLQQTACQPPATAGYAADPAPPVHSRTARYMSVVGDTDLKKRQ